MAGLDKGFVINIDHHPGNAMYGAMNCIDLTAAACGEMVFDLIAALGVPLSVEMAMHVYLTILTDTGGFHYSHISPRTFDICRRCVEAGLDPTAVSRAIYDNNNLGRVRIWGAVLNDMQLSADGRVATLRMDRALAARCGATYDDTEGLINFPLTVKDIEAVVFFKESGPGDWRISMRSKGDGERQRDRARVRRRRPHQRLGLRRHGRPRAPGAAVRTQASMPPSVREADGPATQCSGASWHR